MCKSMVSCGFMQAHAVTWRHVVVFCSGYWTWSHGHGYNILDSQPLNELRQNYVSMKSSRFRPAVSFSIAKSIMVGSQGCKVFLRKCILMLALSAIHSETLTTVGHAYKQKCIRANKKVFLAISFSLVHPWLAELDYSQGCIHTPLASWKHLKYFLLNPLKVNM